MVTATPDKVYLPADFHPNIDYNLHELAVDGGGMKLCDSGNLVPDALKVLLKKSGKEFIKGNFADAFKFASPARFHSGYTHL